VYETDAIIKVGVKFKDLQYANTFSAQALRSE